MPLPTMNVLEQFPEDRAALRRAGVRSIPPPRVRGFACASCHGVRVPSRATKLRDFWNELVAHLTSGLLYGREVQRPPWLAPLRKRPYVPRPNRAPAHRRLQVQERLLKGWSYDRIAADMGITHGTVDTHARHIYKQHRVHGRWELIKALGAPLTKPPMKRELVAARLARGQSYKQIAAVMGMTYGCVKETARCLRMRARRGMSHEKTMVDAVRE